MSCGKDFHTNNCVCDTLLAIVEAQEKVSPTADDCAFSCNTAIRELVAGVTTPANTIPVILTCKNSCLPFVGVGVGRRTTGTPLRPFDVTLGVVFRVVDVDPDTCCATLEILDPEPSEGNPIANCDDPCFFLNQLNNAQRLESTGVCITVDLDCFCAVACIFPITVE